MRYEIEFNGEKWELKIVYKNGLGDVTGYETFYYDSLDRVLIEVKITHDDFCYQN
jgi:hypothetical protein